MNVESSRFPGKVGRITLSDTVCVSVLALFALTCAVATAQSVKPVSTDDRDRSREHHSSPLGAAPAGVPVKDARSPLSRRAYPQYSRLPLLFNANDGQCEAGVLWSSIGAGYAVFLTASDLIFRVLRRADRGLQHTSPRSPAPGNQTQLRFPRKLDRQTARTGFEEVRVRMLGANPHPEIRALEGATTRSHYFIGADASTWKTNVGNWRRLRYAEVWPKIDAVFDGSSGTLEQDFVIAPGGKPEQIELDVAGAKQIVVTASGNLEIVTQQSMFQIRKPLIYQQINGRRISVSGGFTVRGHTKVSFHVSNFDRSRTLIIDPQLLFLSYLNSQPYAVAAGPDGSAYVAGTTVSPNGTALSSTGSGSGNYGSYAFVTKIEPDGSVGYQSYLGGQGGNTYNGALGIAVDNAGNAYITGFTESSNFPNVNQVPGSSNSSGTQTAFVAKLTSAGDQLLYSTYLGGNTMNEVDSGLAIAVDAAGTAYVTGESAWSNGITDHFPAVSPLSGQPASTCPATSRTSCTAAFVSRLDFSAGAPAIPASLTFSTLLGGTLTSGSAVAVDSAGNAYVTGYTFDPSFPTTSGAYQKNAICGTLTAGICQQQQAFLSVMSTAEKGANPPQMLYSSYLGSANGESFGTGIALSRNESNHILAAVTGVTAAPDFPSRNSSQSYHGSLDAFLLEIDPSQSNDSSLLFSTFFGGTGEDFAESISIDASRNIYVSGETCSPDFQGAASVSYVNCAGEGIAGFLAELDTSGKVTAMYLGGPGGATDAYAVAAAATGAVYVVGTTSTAAFQGWNGPPDSFAGFVANFGLIPLTVKANNVTSTNGTVSCGVGPCTFTVTGFATSTDADNCRVNVTATCLPDASQALVTPSATLYPIICTNASLSNSTACQEYTVLSPPLACAPAVGSDSAASACGTLTVVSAPTTAIFQQGLNGYTSGQDNELDECDELDECGTTVYAGQGQMPSYVCSNPPSPICTKWLDSTTPGYDDNRKIVIRFPNLGVLGTIQDVRLSVKEAIEGGGGCHFTATKVQEPDWDTTAATWIYYKATQTWATPGGDAAADGPTITLTSDPGPGGWASFDFQGQLAQSDLEQNGFLITTDCSNNPELFSNQAFNPGDRPFLQVSYVPAASAAPSSPEQPICFTGEVDPNGTNIDLNWSPGSSGSPGCSAASSGCSGCTPERQYSVSSCWSSDAGCQSPCEPAGAALTTTAPSSTLSGSDLRSTGCYFFTVAARDTVGNYSPASATLAIAAPAKASGGAGSPPAGSPGISSVQIADITTSSASLNVVTTAPSCTITCSASGASCTIGSSTLVGSVISYSLSTLTPGTLYNYTVSCGGSSPWNGTFVTDEKTWMHPMLFRTAIQNLQGMDLSGNPDWIALRNEADYYARLPVCPYRSQCPAGTDEIYYDYEGLGWLTAIEDMGLAYQLTKGSDQARASKYSAQLLQIIDAANQTLNTLPIDLTAPEAVDSGFPSRSAAFGLALAFDWVYDALASDGTNRKQVTVATLNAWFDWMRANAYNRTGPATNNYFGAHILGFGAAGYATAGDNPRAAEIRSYVLNLFLGQVQPCFAAGECQGGYPVESYNYGPNHLERLLQYMQAVLDNEPQLAGSIGREPMAEAMAKSLVYNLKPNLWQSSDEGEFYGYTGIMPKTLPLVLATVLTDNTTQGWMRWMINSLAAPGSAGGPPQGSAFLQQPSEFECMIYSCAAAALFAVNPPVPMLVHSSGDDHFYLAGNWGPNGLWASFTAGSTYWSDHQMKGAGHIAIQRGGDYLLVNGQEWRGAGAYSGVTGSPEVDDVLSSWRTNTLYFNDGGVYTPCYSMQNGRQIAGPDSSPYPCNAGNYVGGQGVWGTNRVLASAVDNARAFVYAKADLTSAYQISSYPSPTLSSFVRSFVSLNDGSFVVYDRAISSPMYDKRLFWHFNPNGAVSSNPTTMVPAACPYASPSVSNNIVTETSGSSQLVLTTLLPSTAVTAGPFADGVVSIIDTQASSCRVEVSDSLKSQDLDVLTVMQAGPAGNPLPPVSALQGTSTNGAVAPNMVGAQINNPLPSVVLFAADGTCQSNVTYTAPAGASHVLLDMAPGSYVVNGQTYTVSCQQNVLAFKGDTTTTSFTIVGTKDSSCACP